MAESVYQVLVYHYDWGVPTLAFINDRAKFFDIPDTCTFEVDKADKKITFRWSRDVNG